MKTGLLGFEPVCSARPGVQVHVLAGGLILEESGKEVSVNSPKPSLKTICMFLLI